jgi:adenosylmethionine-8-amino-7-oxononanoate aminotransferase
MCSPRFLRQLEKLVRESGTLLIYDEVMTGFGRTGEWFACTKAETQPDIICLSKGITGGFLPLAVTVCSESIYQAFYADELEKALFHSHSYTGNPIACAAAVASLNLLSQTENRFQNMEAYHRKLAARYLQVLPSVSKLRFCGTIFAFDIELEGGSSYYNKAAADLRSRFLAADLLLRPLGSTVYFMPPYCTDTAILETVYAKVQDVLTGTRN